MRLAHACWLLMVLPLSTPDLVVPGWKKVRADNVIVADGARGVGDVVWFAEPGFGFASQGLVTIADPTAPLPFHHYGAVRLIGVPRAEAASISESLEQSRSNRRFENVDLRPTWVATERLGGGFVSVPASDATHSILRRLRLTRGEGNRVDVHVVEEILLDSDGNPIGRWRTFATLFAVMAAIIVGLLGLRALRRPAASS